MPINNSGKPHSAVRKQVQKEHEQDAIIDENEDN